MSYNPWPFVIVALGSLGFLANTMAQQGDQFDSSSFGSDDFISNDTATDHFTDGSSSTMRVRRDAFDSRPSADGGLESPIFSQRNANTPDGTTETFDELYYGRSEKRQPEFRRGEQQPEADIVDVVPIARRKFESSTTVAQLERPGRSGYGPEMVGRNGRDRSNSRRRSISQDVVDAARLDRDATLQTKETSLIGGLVNKRAAPIIAPLKKKSSENQTLPTASGNGALGRFFGIGGATGAENATVNTNRWVPMWPTLALFFSIAANVFFGYIAMNTHARYQDLIEDMHASESRMDRQSRQRHRESRNEQRDPRPRRARDDDEAAFLQGGIEV